MKKLLLALSLILFLSSCSTTTTNPTVIIPPEPLRYEVIVVEVLPDNEAYIVKTYNYKITNFWVLYTKAFEYNVDDILVVAILEISDGMNETLAVPYLEYIDEIIDGKTFGLSDKCGGVCWYYDYEKGSEE